MISSWKNLRKDSITKNHQKRKEKSEKGERTLLGNFRENVTTTGLWDEHYEDKYIKNEEQTHGECQVWT